MEPLWRCRSYYARYIFFSPRPVYFRGFIILCAFITKTITRLTFLFPFESGLAPVRSAATPASIRLPFTLFQKSSSSLEPDIRGVALFAALSAALSAAAALVFRTQRPRKSPRRCYLRVTVERCVIAPSNLFIIVQHFCSCNYVISPVSDEARSLES